MNDTPNPLDTMKGKEAQAPEFPPLKPADPPVEPLAGPSVPTPPTDTSKHPDPHPPIITEQNENWIPSVPSDSLPPGTPPDISIPPPIPSPSHVQLGSKGYRYARK